jgi:serine/threonine-protein kinase RIO1
MLFSPFVLYEPYLLFMYDLRQSIQILQHSSKTCLEKDVKNIKLQNPTMSEVDIVNHIVKFHFPSKLQGSPKWHKSNLQDLLTMVHSKVWYTSFFKNFYIR